MSEQNTQITFFEEKKQGLEKLVHETNVSNDEELAKVSDIIKGIKVFAKRVQEEMDATILPAKEIITHTKEKYDPYLKTCVNAEQALKAKAGLYMENKEKIRLAQEKKIQDDLESGKIKKVDTAVKKLEALPDQVKSVKTEVSGLSMKKIKDIEITDRNLIPDEYWVVDEQKVKKVALAGIEIPGVKVIEKSSIASR